MASLSLRHVYKKYPGNVFFFPAVVSNSHEKCDHPTQKPEKLYAKGVRAGDVKYFDVNKDGDIDYDNDRMITGKATPDFFGGLTSSFSWKGLELNIFCQYSIGGKIFAAWKGAGQEGTEHLGQSSGSVVGDNAKSYTQYFNVSEYAALRRAILTDRLIPPYSVQASPDSLTMAMSAGETITIGRTPICSEMRV